MRRFLRLLVASIIAALVAVGVRALVPDRSAPASESPAPEPPKIEPAQVDPLPSGAPSRGREEEPPYPTGYVLAGGRITIQMSDGTTRTERDDALSRVERNYVVLDGETLHFKPRARPDSAPSSVGGFATTSPAMVPGGFVQADDISAPVDTWNASTGPVGVPSGRIGR